MIRESVENQITFLKCEEKV